MGLIRGNPSAAIPDYSVRAGATTPAAFAEADAGVAGFLGVGAEDDFVAVLEEGALFAVGELDWVGSALGDFEEAALEPGFGPEMVPLARRSPSIRLQPLLVWWAIIWGNVQ